MKWRDFPLKGSLSVFLWFFQQCYNFIEIGKIAFFQKENSVYSQYGSEGGGYCICVKR